MGKLSVQDLAGILVEKNGLDKEEAKRFVVAIFDVIQSGIETDKLVKVKGLGTFKVVDVDARESVNVNTGDRVLIDSHSKVTFTPDSTMKELVNKPFSGFETVVLNEGVEFEDTPTPKSSANASEDPEKESDEVVEQTATEEEHDPVTEEKMTVADAEETVETPLPSSSWGRSILLLAVGLCVGFVLGYFVGKMNFFTAVDAQQETTALKVDKPAAADTLAQDTALVEGNADSVQAVAPTAPAVVAASEPVAKSTEAEPDYKKYDDMDARVRLGAYYIVGTDQIVEARDGETLAHLSRRYLGEGMSCYVEVYNGMSAKTVLTEGQQVKLPKLKLRKYLKKK